ncbi:hypothetical protein MPH_05867 [Macrophomina phaseolina MS6]|uniref:Uncharacterized protein n=1 Tax=Macrophomina phaseolina (strain MS6) TaxID=1126212 RepID=K2R3I5_MACPH|nr:hypothetical protein MPH_05867 [Macrophomina phaseolina MS6]
MPRLPTSLDNMPDEIPSHTPDAFEGPPTDMWRRYHEIQAIDKQKNALIEELLYRYDSLSEQFKKEIEDHDREREFNRIAQRNMKEMESTILSMRGNMVGTLGPRLVAEAYSVQDRDACVLILIDGDGLIVRVLFPTRARLWLNSRCYLRSSTINSCARVQTVAIVQPAPWRSMSTITRAIKSKGCRPTLRSLLASMQTQKVLPTPVFAPALQPKPPICRIL